MDYDAMRRADPRLSDKIARGVLGEAPWKPGAKDPTSELLTRAFGRGPRGGKVDAAAAAKALGVSRSSVSNWANGKAISKGNRAKLVAKARRVARSQRTTKKGRRQALSRSGLSLSVPGKIMLTGTQGPVNTSDNMREDRLCAVGMNPEQHQQYLEAWAEHGDQGALSFLQQHYSDNYARDWDIGQVDHIGFKADR